MKRENREWIVWMKLKELKCMDKIKKVVGYCPKIEMMQIKWDGPKWKMMQIE